MSTAVDIIRARFAEVKEHTHEDTALRRVLEHTGKIAFSVAIPSIGLLHAGHSQLWGKWQYSITGSRPPACGAAYFTSEAGGKISSRKRLL
jgi:hypothetical protein